MVAHELQCLRCTVDDHRAVERRLDPARGDQLAPVLALQRPDVVVAKADQRVAAAAPDDVIDRGDRVSETDGHRHRHAAVIHRVDAPGAAIDGGPHVGRNAIDQRLDRGIRGECERVVAVAADERLDSHEGCSRVRGPRIKGSRIGRGDDPVVGDAVAGLKLVLSCASVHRERDGRSRDRLHEQNVRIGTKIDADRSSRGLGRLQGGNEAGRLSGGVVKLSGIACQNDLPDHGRVVGESPHVPQRAAVDHERR